MTINLALSGANGRMGKAIIKTIAADPEFNLQVRLTKEHNLDLINELKKVDLLIDFSTPASCLNYLNICSDLKIPVIIGTTGFTAEQQQEIASLAELIPILISPNMSIGVNIIKYLLALLSKFWSENYQLPTKITVNEVHHQHKKDAPSGTALMLAEIINKSFLNPNYAINFKVKRVGAVKGKHQVIFTNDFEELAIMHKVKDRKIFAKGALVAAKWLINHKSHLVPKLYSFFEVMNFEDNLILKI